MAPRPSGTRSTSDGDPGALERARTLLEGWLPGRAADQVLRTSLRSAGLEAGSADGERIAAMLLGPVYRELRSTVPRTTLRRELKHLARSLRSEARRRRDAKPAGAAPPAEAPSEPSSHGALGADPPTPAATPAAVAIAAAAAAPASDATTAGIVVAGAEVAPAPRPNPGSLAQRDQDDVAMALAVLDGVDGVASFDAVGRPLAVRGEVVDVHGLGRVLAAGGRLLSQEGALRSVSVVTSDGTLVAVSVSDRWTAVSGAPDMNLGAVYAALTALEEER